MTPSRPVRSAGLVLLALVVAAAAWWARQREAAPGGVLLPAPGCEPRGRACETAGEGVRISLELPPRVPYLARFPVTVRVGGLGAVTGVRVRFIMEGMDMGVQPVALRRAAAGTWHGTAVLPVCASGRRDWTAEVEAAAGNGRWRARFGFTAGG